MTLDAKGSIKWVISQIIGVNSGRVYAAGAVPKDTAYPILVVAQTDQKAMTGADRIIWGYDDLVLVTALQPGPDNVIPSDLINQVITALNRTMGTITGVECFGCVLENPIPLPELEEEGLIYQRHAAEFRVMVK